MQVIDFDYDLPSSLIAQIPLEKRSASRLLCLDKNLGSLQHEQFVDLPSLLNPGDLLVFNNTRVIPARLFGKKETGGQLEVLIERVLSDEKVLAHVRASKSPKPGTKILFDENISATIVKRHDALFELKFLSDNSILEILNCIGHIPLPPYIERPDGEADHERYQTVFAKHAGAVAAPTAGLHFDSELLKTLENKGINSAFVTLHVGAGTFQPVRVDDIKDHKMHSEVIEVTQDVCDKISQTKHKGNKVIAVGTTSVRCLETAVQEGELKPFTGETDIFITPGYEFKIIDALITNFHLPKSTLLMLVSALAGRANILKAYREAIEEQYRFFSYGDAMYISD